jgi:23S rRNA pseudouridine2605 synthase
VSFGPFQLGDIPIGAVETVKARVLRDQLGARLATAAGADFESEAAVARPVRSRADASPAITTIGKERFRFADRAESDRPKGGEVPPRPDRPGRPEMQRRFATPKPAETSTGRPRKIHFDDGRESQDFTAKTYGAKPGRKPEAGAEDAPRGARPARGGAPRPPRDGAAPRSGAPRPDRSGPPRGPRPAGAENRSRSDRPASRGPRPAGAEGRPPRSPRPAGAESRPPRAPRPAGDDRPARPPRPAARDGKPTRSAGPRPEGGKPARGPRTGAGKPPRGPRPASPGGRTPRPPRTRA